MLTTHGPCIMTSCASYHRVCQSTHRFHCYDTHRHEQHFSSIPSARKSCSAQALSQASHSSSDRAGTHLCVPLDTSSPPSYRLALLLSHTIRTMSPMPIAYSSHSVLLLHLNGTRLLPCSPRSSASTYPTIFLAHSPHQATRPLLPTLLPLSHHPVSVPVLAPPAVPSAVQLLYHPTSLASPVENITNTKSYVTLPHHHTAHSLMPSPSSTSPPLA
jgi:hypothetical protein